MLEKFSSFLEEKLRKTFHLFVCTYFLGFHRLNLLSTLLTAMVIADHSYYWSSLTLKIEEF